ncbi:MAG: YidC/Oxa1 family membrane protein insertase [Armatimonadota bacterium]
MRRTRMTGYKCNRISRVTLVALLVGVLVVPGARAVFGETKADEIINRADSYARRAIVAKSTAERKERFEKAAELYGKVGGDKMYLGTPQGATALLKLAMLHQKMATLESTSKEESARLYAAYETLKRLVNIYDKPLSALEEKLTRTEAREVRQIVERAYVIKEEVAARLDKINSSDWKYQLIDMLVSATGRIPSFSYWFAIILITVIVKILLAPLTKAQFRAMKEMQKVAPLIKKVQEQYKGDQKAIGEKTMEIYRQHKINPFASCLPLLVQMPILMLLYYTIRSYEFQFAKGTFLWIGSSLSHLASFPVMFNPGSLVWFTAKNLAEPDLLLVVLYVISMYVSMKLSNVDPTQAEQQKMMSIMMPVMFAFIFAGFPSAFLLYWLVFNILQTSQQYMILRAPAEVDRAVVADQPVSGGSGEEPEANESQMVKPKAKRRKFKK